MGALWQYIFMLIVLVYQAKGQFEEPFLPGDDGLGRDGEHLSIGRRRPYFCYLRPDQGVCIYRYPRFYYNASEGRCDLFLWSGCGGNENRFLTNDQCVMTCY
ncbi:kunitz-type serine protease inhibitor-like [Maniola jurtina]|uniref:kunitz-type serine protease inhibitor-like n=1 Tax=Maniola jurtina TaxID=191418 RepID=UPI001E68FCBD|nr:kunitz-type serine protease inhibitor-like [Maniola jurtina]